MKKNKLEKALNNLLKSKSIAEKAMSKSTAIQDKIRFHVLSETISKIRNSLIPLTLDFEEAIKKAGAE